MTDVGFGNSAISGMAMAARIMSPFGINMTTGTALPLDKPTAQQIVAELGPLLEDKSPTELAAMTPSEKSRMTTTIIRLCLQAGSADRVRYAE